MCDWKNGRSDEAIEYNEYGNRIQELKDMQLAIVEDERKHGDPLAVFLGCHSAEQEIDRYKADMRSIELSMMSEIEWVNYFRNISNAR